MAYRDLVLAKTPQLYWECQDVDQQSVLIVDSSGNNRPGKRAASILGAPPAGFSQPYSIYLNAAADLLSRTDAALLNQSRVCLEYVFRITAYPPAGKRQWISTWGNQPGGSPENDKGVLLNADGTLTFYVYSNSGERLIVGSKPISLGPHHVVLQVDATGAQLWVDGAIYISRPEYNNSFASYGSATLYFAQFPNTTSTIPTANSDHGSFFVSDIALYAASLTADEIAAHAVAALTAAVLKGTAVLSSGVAATVVLVRRWATYEHVLTAQVASDGKWAAPVPPGQYEVTARGPAGYQPVTHGPVTAV